MPLVTNPTAYADPTQLVQLALTPATAGRFGGDQQQNALYSASAVADSYIGGQFQLPLVTWDYSLALAVCNIAAKFLYDQYGYNPNAPIDALIQRRYDEALTWLASVRDKKIQPQWVDSSGTGQPAGDFVVSDPPVGFTCRGVTEQPVGFELWPWGGW
jgi:phage gp36-like protein